MVTVTFLQLKLSSVATDMFVNVFRVGFHGRVRNHGDRGDIFTNHAEVKRICLFLLFAFCGSVKAVGDGPEDQNNGFAGHPPPFLTCSINK